MIVASRGVDDLAPTESSSCPERQFPRSRKRLPTIREASFPLPTFPSLRNSCLLRQVEFP